VVLLECAAASRESYNKKDATKDNQEYRDVEDLVAEEVEVLRVGALDEASNDDQEEAEHLERK
jgi:hypothetical protein